VSTDTTNATQHPLQPGTLFAGALLAAAAIGALGLLAPPRAAAVLPSGALSQLAAPHECVGESEFAKALCGTSVQGGLNLAYQSQVSPDGKNVYSVAIGGIGGIGGDLIEYERNLANGALTVIGCIAAAPSGAKCAPEHETRSVAAMVTPTALALDPKGEEVYVADQNQGTVIALARDPGTGLLSVLRGTSVPPTGWP
jgi:DNA-binding beta-propeller fold protein YncE